MLKRRDIIVIPVLAGATYAAGTLASRREAATIERAAGTIGPVVVEDAFLASLHRTVSDRIDRQQINEFVALARRNFDWVLHPLTKVEDFDRKLCTEFILNSNLPDIGYDFESYEFVEMPDACQPFSISKA